MDMGWLPVGRRRASGGPKDSYGLAEGHQAELVSYKCSQWET
jgi:hypothetical protein